MITLLVLASLSTGCLKTLEAIGWTGLEISGSTAEYGSECSRIYRNICRIYRLSSPRAKHAGPKGLRAESTRAVTGRRCPHSGKGEEFLTGQPDFFTETAVTQERKVPRWKMNRHSEGYKRAVDQNWGRMAKIGFLDQKTKFWAQKKAVTSQGSPCSGHDRKKLFNEKKCLCLNNQGGKCHFG